MNIYDFADIIRKDLIIKRYHNQNERWTAQFETAEVRDGCFLRGTYGDAKDINSAIADYVDQIKGKELVFNRVKDKQEYSVPISLTV